MGSKKRSNQTQKTDMTTTMAVTGIEPYQQKFNQELGTMTRLFNQQQANKPVLDYSNPYENPNVNPIVANMMSQGLAGLKAQESSGNAQLARSLSTAGGNNSALLAALQRQSKFNTAGQANAMIPKALEAQRGFATEQANLTNAQNQTRLAEAQQNVQNLSQRFNLLNAINQMAGTSAGKTVTEKGTTSSKGKVSSSFF